MDPKTLSADPCEVEVLDVREPWEWQAGHIQGATHIPMDEIPNRLDELGDGPIVSVCRSGNRSDQVAKFLRRKGFDAENLDGGMKAWAKAGLPFSASGGSTGRVV